MTDLSGDQRRLFVLTAILAVLVTIFFGKSLVAGQSNGGARGVEPERSSALVSVRSLARAQSHVATKAKAATTAKRAQRAKRSTVRQRAGSVAPTDSFQVFETRDPFEPPFNNTPTTSVTTPTTTPSGGTTPTTTPPTGTTTTTQAPSFNPGTGTTISVLDVYTDASGATRARVQVGSTVYTVGVGDTFATSYKVVSLNEPCGQFLFGDSHFTLCEGEETIK